MRERMGIQRVLLGGTECVSDFESLKSDCRRNRLQFRFSSPIQIRLSGAGGHPVRGCVSALAARSEWGVEWTERVRKSV